MNDGASQKSGLKIVIVDDNALACMGTASMLEDMGHRAIETYSAREALNLLQRDPTIDLVITDIGMSDMTGDELAAHLRATQPSLPVIFATGYTLPDKTRDATIPVLGKPIEPELLAQTIETIRASLPKN
jgi:CheY-like chemotaxis protein